MLEIKNVHVSFERNKQTIEAVKNVTIHVEKGDIFGIIGYSGAGKSSLLRCINLLEKTQSGKIILDGVDLLALSKKALRKERTNIGMIFQQFNLISSKTVYDNIAFHLKVANVPKEKHEERIIELLELVGLSDKLYSYPSELSGGQKQRVGIAKALANNPKLLLCDEATSALDPDTTQQILSLLKNIHKKLNITILLVTHEMEVIKSLCNKVAVMEKGEIVECDSVYSVFSKPKSSLMKQFVANLYEDNLPEEIYKNSQETSIVQLLFDDNQAEAPVINNVKEHFNITISILQGKIEYIQSKPLGHLTVALRGQENERLKVIDYLKNTLLDVKVVFDDVEY